MELKVRGGMCDGASTTLRVASKFACVETPSDIVFQHVRSSINQPYSQQRCIGLQSIW